MDIVYHITISELTSVVKDHALTFLDYEAPGEPTITTHFHGEDSSASEMILRDFSHFLVTFTDNTPAFHYTARQVADMVVEYLSVKHPAVLGLNSGYSFVLVPSKTAKGDFQLGRLELIFAGSLF